MEPKKLKLPDGSLVLGFYSDGLSTDLSILKATASHDREDPEGARAVIDIIVGELARKFKADFIEGYLTFPEVIAKRTSGEIMEMKFQRFAYNVKELSNWAVKTQGRYWKHVRELIDDGARPLPAIQMAVQGLHK